LRFLPRQLEAYAHLFIERPICNDILTYEVSRGTDGRLQAGKVAFLGESITNDPSMPTQVVAAILFMFSIAGLAFFAILPKIVLLGYIFVSMIAFLAYWSDKAAAENQISRIPERNDLCLNGFEKFAV